MIVFLLIVICVILAAIAWPNQIGTILSVALALLFFGFLYLLVGYWAIALFVFGVASTAYKTQTKEAAEDSKLTG